MSSGIAGADFVSISWSGQGIPKRLLGRVSRERESIEREGEYREKGRGRGGTYHHIGMVRHSGCPNITCSNSSIPSLYKRAIRKYLLFILFYLLLFVLLCFFSFEFIATKFLLPPQYICRTPVWNYSLWMPSNANKDRYNSSLYIYTTNPLVHLLSITPSSLING